MEGETFYLNYRDGTGHPYNVPRLVTMTYPFPKPLASLDGRVVSVDGCRRRAGASGPPPSGRPRAPDLAPGNGLKPQGLGLERPEVTRVVGGEVRHSSPLDLSVGL